MNRSWDPDFGINARQSFYPPDLEKTGQSYTKSENEKMKQQFFGITSPPAPQTPIPLHNVCRI